MSCEFPIRCFSCGKVVNHKLPTYLKLLEQNVSKNDALNTLEIRRYCCRRMFIGHIEMFDKIQQYK